MMNPKLNINNLVKRLLPWHKRQPVRLSILRALISPLRILWTDFDIWRDDTRMIINVNSQVAVLEGYLKKKYNNSVKIKIVTYFDGALEIGLIAEGDINRVDIPMEQEEIAERKPPELPLQGEIRERFGDADFIIYIPIDIDINLIKADIEKFKQALVKYKIIQN